MRIDAETIEAEVEASEWSLGVIREDHGTVVLSVTGAISAELFSELDAEFRLVPVRLPVIINLNALTLGNTNVLEQLVGFLHSLPGSRVCLVCGRLSARRLLRLVGAADIVPIFMTTADAMQVLILHEHGYGPGWSMTIPTRPAAASGADNIGTGHTAGPGGGEVP